MMRVIDRAHLRACDPRDPSAKVSAWSFVGDAFEEEIDAVSSEPTGLDRLGTPLLQEGSLGAPGFRQSGSSPDC